MPAIDGLTVCITSFRRASYLDRAISSVVGAGIRRLAISAVEPTAEVRNIIAKYRATVPWLSFDVNCVEFDIGCNCTWELAAYLSRTPRVLLLHDDDTLSPQLGRVYEEKIAPALEGGCGFASWHAELLYDDGTRKPCNHWSGPTRVTQSTDLLRVVAHRGRLSLSPVISVLDRAVLINACKESAQMLTHNDCLERPGMLLGTEIVVYMRHIEAFPKYLYVDQALSCYGAHDGSGTVKAEKSGDLSKLTRGYDRARDQGARPKPRLNPKLILAYSDYDIATNEEQARVNIARASWDFHFSQSDFVELPVRPSDLRREGFGVGGDRRMPYVRDVLDYACSRALMEDIVVYCNRDIGLTTPAAERIKEGIVRGRGVTVCPRRVIDPMPGRHYKNVTNGRADGGFDVMAMTPAWWKQNREKMPDMLIAREAWDTCFRTLAEEWADNREPTSPSLVRDGDWQKSAAYTDNVCWHKEHLSPWQVERHTCPGQRYNRQLALQFFTVRGNRPMIVQLTDHVEPKPPLRTAPKVPVVLNRRQVVTSRPVLR